MADELNGEISFSPVLIMEYIRQTTVARFLNSESLDIVVRFKIKKEYYDEMKAYHQQVQFIRLYDEYDEENEILSVKTDEVLLNRFREQKSLVEIANKYENQYKERYKKYIEVME
ncbi:MAG: hypothetical protein IJZ30_02485 [Alphaproteobacteria bacterium]|nr:hypothetical protein [Alphaproteobacteria bacterium]